MPCFHPVPQAVLIGFKNPTTGKKICLWHQTLSLEKDENRIVDFVITKSHAEKFEFLKPHINNSFPAKIGRRGCNVCRGCRAAKTASWTVRAIHEAQMHPANSFITLTFNNEHLPENRSLDHTVYQEFMKRLRDHLDRHYPDGDRNLRYYMVGEYGEQFGRPHYHACLFGFDFPDRRLWKVVRGNPLYTSEFLAKVWGFGFCTIGALNKQSAAYVARYIQSKNYGALSDQHYSIYDSDTDQYYIRQPEYNKFSLKPGIGSTWFDKYQIDVFPDDICVIDGKKFPPPPYYSRCYEKLYPENFAVIKNARIAKANKNSYDNSPKRLLVREKVFSAKLNQLPRGMESNET